jgi:hypothetical protein
MMTFDGESRLHSRLRILFTPKGVAALVLAAVAVLALNGCDPPAAPVTSSSSGTGKATHCEELLTSALDMVQPERLGISSDRDNAVDLLNQWLPECAPAAGSAGSQARKPDKLLPPEVLARATLERFVGRDAWHIRDCVQAKAAADFAVRGADDDLGRVVQLFYYVVRNVQLVEREEDALPLTPREILLLGRGTAEDRAWIFANSLRQLRIDAVLLRPQAKTAAASNAAALPWLIGVLLDGEVYLFDSQLGWPIPAPDDDPKSLFVKRPATLAQAVADDALLRRLDLDAEHAYPLKSDDLTGVKVELIGDSSFWSSRMKRLQAALAGDRALVVADGLEDDETGEGVVARVAATGGGKWSAADVSLWSYPEQQIHGFGHLTEAQSQKLQVRALPFRVPYPISVSQNPDGSPNVRIGQPERTQLKTRTAQLMGNHAIAVRSYATIVTIPFSPTFDARLPIAPEIRRVHAQAAEDASIWIGLCQLELGSFAAATATFREYLKNYKRGTWSDTCFALLAWSLAEQGQIDDALKSLRLVSDKNPQHQGYELLIRRWEALEKPAEAEARED